MSRILLTGATGHLGQVVTRHMVQAGIPLLAIGRRADALRALENANTSPHLATAVVDLTRSEMLEAAIAQHGPFERVVHLAAEVDAAAGAEAHISRNFLATVSLVTSLRQSVRQIVNLSSVEVYGMPPSGLVREDCQTSPITYYGVAKLAAEKFLDVFSAEAGAVVTHLRCASIYGPAETIRRATTVFINNALDGKPIPVAGDGSELRDYIYIEDAARAVLAALEAQRSGAFNLSGGAPLSIADMARLVVGVSEKNIAIEHKERSKPPYDLALDNSKIRAEIGFVPETSMEAGLRKQYQSALKSRQSNA